MIHTAESRSVSGGNFAQFCITTTDCTACDVQAFTNARTTVNNGQYVCARQVAPATVPSQANATIAVGSAWANFLVSTGAEIGAAACNFDVDGNGATDALTDGLLLLRAMFGLTGTAVTNGAVGSNATRSTWSLIRTYLNGNCGTAFSP